MFSLTLVDHLRLTFGHVIYSHRAHAQLAGRYSRWNRWQLAGEALLMLATLVTAVTVVTTGELIYAVAGAVAAAAALCTVIVRLIVDFEARSNAHRACSTQLWHIREQYRALLADLRDGELTLEQARLRRDALMGILRDVYDKAPPADRAAYEAARREVPADHDAVLSDDEIDRFLPASLQRDNKSAA
jgi:SMODS and SLOG-associating 2TM effector domain family 4